jgi:hypothetical protein
MLNLVSLLIGLFAGFLTVFAYLPLLGWANWFILPIALVGLFVGVLSSHDAGRNLNLVVLAAGAVRLMIGGGIL